MHCTANRPKIQHRPSPTYHNPYARPPPRPPDITDPLDSWKDLLDNDSDRKLEIEENSPFQEGIISKIYVLHTRTSRIKRPNRYYKVSPKVFT